MGGLARKATIINDLINAGKDPIIVDSGNLFFPKNIIDPGVTMEASIINAEIIRKSFNEMGCDAFSPGSKDFAAGLDFLLEQYGKSKFPFISCNIYDMNKELLFKPYVIRKSKGKKIGIIGLSSPFELENIIVENPIVSLERVINQINNKVDFILLLFNGVQKDLNELYKLELPIDMILNSGRNTRSSDGGSKIPTFIAGDKGKVLYEFEINIIDNELPYVDVAWCENTITRVSERLNKMKRGDETADLYELYKNDEKTMLRIKKYESQIDRANQLQENAINSINFKKIELNKLIFDQTDILKIVDEGKLKIKELGIPLLPSDDHHHHHHHDHHHHDH